MFGKSRKPQVRESVARGIRPKSKRNGLVFDVCCVAASIALFVTFEMGAIDTL
jgi:hypothetical protein